MVPRNTTRNTVIANINSHHLSEVLRKVIVSFMPWGITENLRTHVLVQGDRHRKWLNRRSDLQNLKFLERLSGRTSRKKLCKRSRCALKFRRAWILKSQAAERTQRQICMFTICMILDSSTITYCVVLYIRKSLDKWRKRKETLLPK
jgi:hypothetical protein